MSNEIPIVLFEKISYRGGNRMFKSGFVLVTDLHIDAAKFNKTMITIWIQGYILDYSGYIKSYTEHSVTIDDFKYLRANYAFKVR